MSISSALSIAVSGLRTNSKLVELASNNLANALTPGYARKSVNVETIVLGGRGAGVLLGETQRAYSEQLTNTRRVNDGTLAFSSTRSAALGDLSDAIGDTNDPDSLFNRYAAFEETLRQLADSPETPARQQDAVLRAKDLAASFNSLAAKNAEIRQEAETEITLAVDRVNTALVQINEINADIVQYRVDNRDATALEDRRETLLDEVAAYLPIRTNYKDDGTVVVLTQESIRLVDVVARQISYSPTSVLTPDIVYANGTGALSGLSVGTTDITPGGPATQAISGGALAALFEVRDDITTEYQAQIDALAADLVERFETVGLDPTLAPGSAGLFTDAGNPLDPTYTTNLSGRLAVNASVDPDQSGIVTRIRDGLGAGTTGPSSNGVFPRAMLDVLTEVRDSSAIPGLAGLRAASTSVASVSELRALARINAESETATATAAREAISVAESELIGVDTDTELQDLLVIEQAYAANAQVIRTASAMLDELRTLT